MATASLTSMESAISETVEPTVMPARGRSRHRLAAVLVLGALMVVIAILLLTTGKRTSTSHVATPTAKPSNPPAGPAVEPATVEPATVEPATVEPATVEPAKVEPAKVEPAKVEPAKATSQPATTEPATARQPGAKTELAGQPTPPDPKTPAVPPTNGTNGTNGTTSGVQGEAPKLTKPTKAVVKLGVPATLSPRDDARFSCAAFGTEIELVWNAVPGATGYVVEVARDTGFQSIAATIPIDGTVATFRPLAPGTFVWRVSARDASGAQSAYGSVRSFICTARS